MATDKWYSDPNLVASFGTALTDAEVLEDSDDFKSFLTSPFKYNDEFAAWQEAGYPTTNDDSWDEFVEAITPDSEDEEEETDDE